MSTGFLIFPIGYAPTDNGAVIPNGKLTFSRTGTSTLQNTYSDSALTVPNANPVVLNAEGYLDTKIYGDPSTGFNYRIKFTDSADVQIWQVDDVTVTVDAATIDGIDSTDLARLSTDNTFTQSDAGASQLRQKNSSTGTAATARIGVQNSSHETLVVTTSTGYSGAFLSSGPSGEQSVLYNDAAISLVIGTNSTARLVIDGSGGIDFKGGATSNFKVEQATAAAIAAAANAINTSGKVAGKLLLDTTNHKLYTARGANATDPWDLADGSASVTPS